MASISSTNWQSYSESAPAKWSFYRPSGLHKYRHSEAGSWALVTGASDGIGHSFAEELSLRGFNVLLHGRNQKKLEGVRGRLLAQSPDRSVEIVVADTSKNDGGYSTVVDKVKTLPGKLTVLVNNVGGATTYPQYTSLARTSHADIDTMLNMNIRFATQLTATLIPQLNENGPSLIMNIGSSGGIIGVPYIVTYSGTKAYIHTFSKALKAEMVTEGLNVNVIGYIVGSVETASNPHIMPLNTGSRETAASCLDRVSDGSDALLWAHWKHPILTLFTLLLPTAFANKYLGAEMKKRAQSERKSA
ncbi:hypothetical protein LTR37_007214 [Vermiconidia calcicola]|uniref:Uncharacterized protein n=1 Tax=Vermiconidia calcicola TaxID=1690605 RepID=A0ACC3NDX0_9PEZI|nr:hypothetical protein LTR37_007214 [Vermiconidia calcicola]